MDRLSNAANRLLISGFIIDQWGCEFCIAIKYKVKGRQRVGRLPLANVRPIEAHCSYPSFSFCYVLVNTFYAQYMLLSFSVPKSRSRKYGYTYSTHNQNVVKLMHEKSCKFQKDALSASIERLYDWLTHRCFTLVNKSYCFCSLFLQHLTSRNPSYLHCWNHWINLINIKI